MQRCKRLCDERVVAHHRARSDSHHSQRSPLPRGSFVSSDMLARYIEDSVGRIATILFAYKFGPALEAECKKYRFLADIFNDSAMVMDCLSPAFPRMARVGLLCVSGSLRALCGVAAGASKASLSVHFAKSGNVGELNAKVESSTAKK